LRCVYAVELDEPLWGSWKRSRRSATVVLPAPVGPTSATGLRRDLEVEAAKHLLAAEWNTTSRKRMPC